MSRMYDGTVIVPGANKKNVTRNLSRILMKPQQVGMSFLKESV